MVQAKSVRLGFTKIGKLQFISHLDLARTMSRVMVRADIPIWYTEGFNPRPKLVFSLPLSIGTESICEFVDFKIVEELPLDEIAERIGAQFAPEMKVNGVWIPENKFTDIAWAEYEIKICTPHANIEALGKINEMLEKPIVIIKKSKSGEKEVDIRPLIKSLRVSLDGQAIVLHAMLSCTSMDYLNPEYLVKAVADKLSIDFGNVDSEYYSILRTRVKLGDGITDFR
ncbi:MAG: DUF2344 domain-containing protein [Ruminococcaceae bacterium]|nr:DUF2344 domain-containing protein [Oscillospiraceae bacterium]